MIAFDIFAYSPSQQNRDAEAETIFIRHGGRSIGKGTFIPTGERDIQFRFDSEPAAYACKRDLIKAGFRAEMRVVEEMIPVNLPEIDKP